MKNAFALFLFFLFFAGSLIPKVGMEQSFKANELLKHFQDHKRISKGNFSFSDFLRLHYAADSKHAKTTKHPSLPTFNFSGVSAYVLPTLFLIFLIQMWAIFSRRRNEHLENLYHFSLGRVLIAPPRTY